MELCFARQRQGFAVTFLFTSGTGKGLRHGKDARKEEKSNQQDAVKRNNQRDQQRPGRRLRILKRKAETFLIIVVPGAEEKRKGQGRGGDLRF